MTQLKCYVKTCRFYDKKTENCSLNSVAITPNGKKAECNSSWVVTEEQKGTTLISDKSFPENSDAENAFYKWDSINIG